MTPPFDPDLERYTLTSEQVIAVEDLFAASLAEAGYPTKMAGRLGWAFSTTPDDVFVRACNIVRAALGVDQFPDVETWRRWTRNLDHR